MHFSATTRLATLAVAIAAVTSACGDDASAGGAELGHIHALGVNPADGALYAASHHGVFRVTGTDPPEQIADRDQDFMGFTVIGPDHFLASGHPGPDHSGQPSHLGLIESTDAAESWTNVSLSGEADFHAMDTSGETIYGHDSVTGQLMASTDRHDWDARATVEIADLAAAPDSHDQMIVTTRAGLASSSDGGRSFADVRNAPMLSLVDWPDPSRLVGVTPDGTAYLSVDRGATWEQRGEVAGAPQAVTADGGDEIYVATSDAIYLSRDGAATFDVFAPL